MQNLFHMMQQKIFVSCGLNLTFFLFFASKEIKKNIIDVIVVMGSSTDENFAKQKQTVNETIEQETNSDIIYGVIQYGKTAAVRKSLQERMDGKAFQQLLPSLSWNEVGEALQDCLRLANVSFMEYGRPNARKILLVFSDKPSNDSVSVNDIAKKLQENGVKIVPVSIANRSDGEKLPELAGQKPLRVDEDNEPEKTGKKVSEEIMKGKVIYDL